MLIIKLLLLVDIYQIDEIKIFKDKIRKSMKCNIKTSCGAEKENNRRVKLEAGVESRHVKDLGMVLARIEQLGTQKYRMRIW